MDLISLVPQIIRGKKMKKAKTTKPTKPTKTYSRPLNKAAEKAGISMDRALKIIAYKHEIKNLTPKVVNIKIDLDGDILKEMTKIASALKIDIEYVIGSILVESLERELYKTSESS